VRWDVQDRMPKIPAIPTADHGPHLSKNRDDSIAGSGIGEPG
jgi:hypothetical protein